MSDHQLFLSEKDRINVLIQKGYRIGNIFENLNGSYVDFVHPTNEVTETLHISTANGRKYFSSLLIKQNSSSYIKEE